jgi:hypothetical protein
MIKNKEMFVIFFVKSKNSSSIHIFKKRFIWRILKHRLKAIIIPFNLHLHVDSLEYLPQFSRHGIVLIFLSLSCVVTITIWFSFSFYFSIFWNIIGSYFDSSISSQLAFLDFLYESYSTSPSIYLFPLIWNLFHFVYF